MKAKKLVSIILAIAMLCSLCAVNVMADEQTLCQKVGIGDLSSHKVIKFDGNENSDTPTLQTNTQVINLGNSIGLFSSPWSTYRVTGASACAAIVNSVVLNPEGGYVTESGYSLEYVSPLGNNDPSQTVENGGKIVATKDGETIEIPVVDTAVLAVLGGDDTEGDGSLANNQTQLHSLVKASRGTQADSGKAYNDEIFRFTISQGTTTYNSQWRRQGFDTFNTPKTEFTIEFQVRLTGDAKLTMELEATGWGGMGLLNYTADGVLSYHCYDQNKTIENKVCNDADKWHNIAFTYDYCGNRIIYYFDGERLGTLGHITNRGVLAALRYIVPQGTYNGGTVDLDNMVVRRGYYTGRGTSIAGTALADNVGIDTTAKKVYYKSDSLTVDALKTALAQITDASEITLYTTSGLTAVASGAITDGNVAVLKTSSQAQLETYEIVKKADDELLIASANGEIKARPIYNHASGQLMIAEYTADGKELLGVKTGDDASLVSIADKTSEGRIYKSFLWNDLTSAQPVLSSVLYPAE